MTILRYIGTHQPQDMVIEVDESDVQRLLDSGEYETLKIKKSVKIFESSKEEIKDDDSKRTKSRF